VIAVVDANIAAALFLDLAYSDRARNAVADATEIIAPDLIHAELANTLWKLITSKRVNAAFARQVLKGLSSVVSEFVSGEALAGEAVEHASALGHPAYDCFYFALARQRDAKLFTADRRFAAVLRRADPAIDHEFVAG